MVTELIGIFIKDNDVQQKELSVHADFCFAMYKIISIRFM